ncbi:MAG: YbaK/EbsC family protein [Patescibacteria group bacterium]|jgi:prolyl-tRNA editing enzyme YbaK/EbsC (Cys-tRNA(Pro) deacylase)
MAKKKISDKIQAKARKVKKSAPEKEIKLPPKVAKLISYLLKAGVSHDLLRHKTVYTAYDAAATMKKKLSEMAKSLLIKADKDYYAVILPADHNLDMEKLKKIISKAGGKDIKAIKIPGEKVMTEVLKVKNMAMTAFGGLHDLPVIAEKNLEKAKKIIFPSGGFNYSVEMKLKDFVKLENAILGKFGVKRKKKK